jgi:hypothetical protein
MAHFVKDEKHVLFEICNEPNGVSWSTVKSYADNLISAIRAIDEDIVIIVGTPTWSQDIHEARQNPVLNPHNVMYAFHFYAGSHMGLLERVRSEAALIPIFATEWGTSTYSGDGGVFSEQAKTFLDLFRDASGQKISWAQWSFADKDESSAALLPRSCSSQDFDTTSCSGTMLKNYIRVYVETCPIGPTPPPTPQPPTPPPTVWTYAPTVPTPSPTPVPPASGQCYVVECGCPPFVNGQSWCQEGAAGIINSPWCLESASSCAQCNGILCSALEPSPTSSPTPYPSPQSTYAPTANPTPYPSPNQTPHPQTAHPTPYPSPNPTLHPPTAYPTPQPSLEGIACTDNPTPWLEQRGRACGELQQSWLCAKCKANPYWSRNNFCQYSCFAAGCGYDGDVCGMPTRAPSSAPPVGYDVYALEKECAGEAIFDGENALCFDSCRKCPFCKFATTYGSHSLRCRLRTHCDELVEAVTSSVTYQKTLAGETRRLLVV